MTALGRARTSQAKSTAGFALAEKNLLESDAIFAKSPGPSPKEQRDRMKAIGDPYATWDKAEPGGGHGTSAANWKAKMDAMKPIGPEAAGKR